jgi:hypothetical protein
MASAHADPHAAAEAHHPPADPNAAPTHGDVRSSFSRGQLAVAWILGAIAIVAGIALGMTVTNT